MANDINQQAEAWARDLDSNESTKAYAAPSRYGTLEIHRRMPNGSSTVFESWINERETKVTNPHLEGNVLIFEHAESGTVKGRVLSRGDSFSFTWDDAR